jgi:hypothetical protein
MMMIRSTELVLIEIMSVIFICYPCNSTRDALHSRKYSSWQYSNIPLSLVHT